MSVQSPHSLLAASVATCLAVASIAVALALDAPWLGLDVVATEHGGLRVAGVDPEGPAGRAGALSEGDLLRELGHGRWAVPATAELAMEEPDLLPSYAELNALMETQTRLSTAADAGALHVTLQDGRRVRLRSEARPLGDLPALFWLQLACGIGGALTGALVWGARRRDRAAGLYALTGVGYLIFAPAAAVYSTRELLLDGTVFRVLSALNHLGALLFTASLAALLWHYPQRLGRMPIATACYVAALLVWGCDVAQLVSPALFHFGVLGVFASSFVFAAAQWWKTRGLAAERAALRWFLLSIYLATGLFAGAIIVPAALGRPVLASQGLMFGAFLLMYWGLALGIVRYRLFALERWWHAIVGWFVGGLCVVVLDGVLLSGLSLPEGMALPTSVAVVGWLYFPVRQFVWARIGHGDPRDLASWLPGVLPLLLDVPRDGADAHLRARWPEILRRVWQPLRVDSLQERVEAPSIEESGMALRVPSLDPAEAGHVVVCAAGGKRLFTRADVDTFRVLQRLVELALETYRARDDGAEEERQRIRRDLHDDIGARLLTLLHACGPEHQPLVREALVDTRALVQTLELGATDLATAAEAWHQEAAQRCAASGVRLGWKADLQESVALSPREVANLTRVLREAVSNALRHAHAGRIDVEVESSQAAIRVRVADDGQAAPLDTWPAGRGRRIMQERAEEIGADLRWRVAGGCAVELTLQPGEGGCAAALHRNHPPATRTLSLSE